MPEPTYPQNRPKFFAYRYCRLLAKTCAAQEIGHISFVLCVTIAMLEDAKRYKGAVTFYSEQLMPVIGVTKWDSLDNARKRSVAEGWLVYVPGNRGMRKPGRYWVTIPSGLDDLEDTSCDETHSPANGDWQESHYPANGDRGGDVPGIVPGIVGGNYLPYPLPLRERARTTRSTFVKPTPTEVQAYWSQAKLHGDAAQFYDHFETTAGTRREVNQSRTGTRQRVTGPGVNHSSVATARPPKTYRP